MNTRIFELSGLGGVAALLLPLAFGLPSASVQAHCAPKHPQHCDGGGGAGEPADFMIEFLGGLDGSGATQGDRIDETDNLIENGQPFDLDDLTTEGADAGLYFTCTNKRNDTYGPPIEGVANVSTWFIADTAEQGYAALIARYTTTLLPYDPNDPDTEFLTGTLDIRTSDLLGLPLIDLNVGESITADVVFVQANGGGKGKDSCRNERDLTGLDATTITITRIAPQ